MAHKILIALLLSEVNLIFLYRYTTVGRETLSQIKTGDVIRSAKLVEGQDRLVLPKDD